MVRAPGRRARQQSTHSDGSWCAAARILRSTSRTCSKRTAGGGVCGEARESSPTEGAARSQREIRDGPRFAHYAPPTLSSRDRRDTRVSRARDVVSSLDGMGGPRRVRAGTTGSDLGVILETAPTGGKKTVLVQRFIRKSRRGSSVMLVAGPAGQFTTWHRHAAAWRIARANLVQTRRPSHAQPPVRADRGDRGRMDRRWPIEGVPGG